MSVGSTIVRQWHLLRLLPKGPRRIDTATLERHLRTRGVAVHRRTIQRDLVELGTVFPIISDERSKPYGWRWADGAELLCAIPALSGARELAPEIDIVLHVRAAALRAVTEGLRDPEGQSREVNVDAHPSDGDASIVRARLPDGCSLRRWLFGFADALVVIAPAHLRAELAEKAMRVAVAYRDD